MRRPAALASLAVLTATGLLAAGCGQSGLAQAEQACTHVERSIALYQRSLRMRSAATAAAERQLAATQLQVAEPLAAAANSSDGTWNGLMTTIEEDGRVPEAELILALRSQCSEVASIGAPPAPPAPTVPGSTGAGPAAPSTSVPTG